MNGDDLHRLTRERALELPGSEITHPFGPESTVFTVRDKMFALQMELHGERIVNLKVDPDHGAALRGAHEAIRPGYHMNKRHWVSLHPGDLDPDLVEDLVLESYLLVVRGLPKSRRPVDPETYGGR